MAAATRVVLHIHQQTGCCRAGAGWRPAPPPLRRRSGVRPPRSAPLARAAAEGSSPQQERVPGPRLADHALRFLGVVLAAILIWDPRFCFSASLGRVCAAAAAAAAASPLAPLAAAGSAAAGRATAAAAAALGRLLVASPLAGIVVAALACVAVAVAGLLAAQAAGQLRRRPAFTLLMRPKEDTFGAAAEEELAQLEEHACF